LTRRHLQLGEWNYGSLTGGLIDTPFTDFEGVA